MGEAVSLRLRVAVLERDGYRCVYCGRKSNDSILEVDHVVPRSLGGSSDSTNLVTSCRDCNRGKGVSPMSLPAGYTPMPVGLAFRHYGHREKSTANRLSSEGAIPKNGNGPSWVCEKCHVSLGRNDGFLAVNYADIHKYERDHADPGQADVDGLEFEPARWHVFHIGCETILDNSYWFGSDRIATWRQVAEWSAHLGGKRWINSTDWFHFIQTAGDA